MLDHGKDALWQVIHDTPVIDNHAHPLLKRSAMSTHTRLAIATEAHGPALESSRRSLAHLRAVRQLSSLLGCEPTWEAVDRSIHNKHQSGDEDWTKRCLEGIECVLVDDGLDSPEHSEDYDYFDRFTRSASKRIVRIEPIVAEIIDKYSTANANIPDALESVTRKFQQLVRKDIQDPEVVGFKSVICYRTGLAIPRAPDGRKAQGVMASILSQMSSVKTAPKFTRLDHPGLNEWFVHILAREISAADTPHKKPIQFHTGLGDNDITLTNSSPAHLQEFIRAYPDVPMVLLHSGYPFTRELGYLAAMYANVYADIGEVFPFLSRDGQEGVVRQILELCPASKVLWSTDGHWFPETYLLAVMQVREVLWTVLGDFVRKGDLATDQAADLVRDVFFRNSNSLYGLGLELTPLKGVVAGDEGPQRDALGAISRFIGGGDNDPRFLRIYFTDLTGLSRMRVVPMRRVLDILKAGEEFSLGVTKASMGLTQNDAPAPGVSPSGEWRMHPDLSTLSLGPRKGHLSTRGEFREKDGSPVALCPRSTLRRVLDKARARGLSFMLGFEIELVLMRRAEGGGFIPLDVDGHAWATASGMDHVGAAEVLEEAVAALEDAGIYVELVHSEAAQGQYEVVLPKAPAMEAVDRLHHARNVISALATAKGYRMTLHPKPFPVGCGTAAHVHMSISEEGGDDMATYGPFYAGILRHLRAVFAFTNSSRASYERLIDGWWAGGTWVTWGTQNRETPLRAVEGSHWEVKCMDGMSNMYLAMAALVGAGVLGHEAGEDLGAWKDLGERAAVGLSKAERAAAGATEKVPGSVEEALGSLEKDKALCEMMGTELVDRYLSVKRAEEALLETMGVDERRLWLMERY